MKTKPAGKKSGSRFSILLCGEREIMGDVRRFIPASEEIHLQYSSSPRFLLGRAIFHPPDMVLLGVTKDTLLLRSALREFTAQFPRVPVFALTDRDNYAKAVELVKLGASEYFCLPADRRKMVDQIARMRAERANHQQKSEFVQLQRKVYELRHIVGQSAPLRQMIERAQKLIRSNTLTVLITGETGTGKELLARALHYNGKTSEEPFVDIACSALPENLLETELFGYEKGAFTDARERKIGLFEMAGQGTIFLDEIGDISLAMQSKLLKVIEDRVMRRVGGIRDIAVKARIIAATSVDLDARMKSGEFRKDLFHRLKILPLDVPPLRKRREDIPLLVDSFLGSFNAEYQKAIKGVTPAAMELLCAHAWEGNVRELKHAIERAVLLQEGEWITVDDFEFRGTPPPAPRKGRYAADDDTDDPRHLADEPSSFTPSVSASHAAGASTLQDDGKSFTLVIPREHATIAAVQQLLARKILTITGGSKVRAARILGVSRPRLDRILRNGSDTEDP